MSVRAILHIGSSNVSGALIDGGKIVFQTEQECRLQEKLDSKIFLDDVASVLKQVLNNLLGAKMGNPEKVIVFLASPFIAGRLNVINHNADKPFHVTEKLVAELLNQETEKIKSDKAHTLIDSKIMRFRLNGYTVNVPHGQSASRLELAHYVSITTREMVEKFGGVIKSAIHHDKIEWHSSSFAIFISLRDERPADQSFVLVDVGGELTELTLVWRGIIRETLSYPLGSHALVRETMKKGDHVPVVARAKLAGSKEKENGHRLNTEDEWNRAFSAGLQQVLQHRFWSGEIILLVEERALETKFKEILGRVDLGKLVFSMKAPTIDLLETKTLSLLANFCAKIK